MNRIFQPHETLWFSAEGACLLPIFSLKTFSSAFSFITTCRVLCGELYCLSSLRNHCLKSRSRSHGCHSSSSLPIKRKTERSSKTLLDKNKRIFCSTPCAQMWKKNSSIGLKRLLSITMTSYPPSSMAVLSWCLSRLGASLLNCV